MLSSFLQFAFNLALLSVVAVGVVMAIPAIAGWLHSKQCLQLSPCKAKIASLVLVALGVFLMGNIHALEGWLHVLATICLVGFGAYGLKNLHSWKVWEKWRWPDEFNKPPAPPSIGCSS